MANSTPQLQSSAATTCRTERKDTAGAIPRSRRRSCRFGILAAVMLLPCALPACTGPAHSRASMFAPPERTTAVGDWNDLDASLEIAVGKCEMAVVQKTEDTPSRRTYELLTVTDEPVVLTARRLAAAPDDSLADPPPGPIELTASVGRFGDTNRERQLLSTLKRRIEQLAGVDYAPAR